MRQGDEEPLAAGVSGPLDPEAAAQLLCQLRDPWARRLGGRPGARVLIELRMQFMREGQQCEDLGELLRTNELRHTLVERQAERIEERIERIPRFWLH
jgi:hypothetical protein